MRGRSRRARISWRIRATIVVVAILATASVVYAAFEARGAYRARKHLAAVEAARARADLGPRERWELEEAHLFALGQIRCAAGRRALEALIDGHVRADPYADRRIRRLLHLLGRYYPRSRSVEAMREYERIRGKPYLSRDYRRYGFEGTEPGDLATWAERWPWHPGADDAWYVAGRILRIDDPVGAVTAWWRGLESPDGDMRQLILNRLEEWSRDLAAEPDGLRGRSISGLPAELRVPARYALAVHALRAHFFAGAARELVDIEAPLLALAADPEWAGEVFGGMLRRDFPASLREQVELARGLAELDSLFRAATSARERAEVRREMARRAFRAPDGFACLVVESRAPHLRWGTSAVTRDSEIRGLHESIGYAHALGWFDEAFEIDPSHPEAAEIEYSAALCFWRVKTERGLPYFAASPIDREIVWRFQRVADIYPESTLADEALWLAGVHHHELMRGDGTVLDCNIERIIALHPDGDLVREARSRYPRLARRLDELEMGAWVDVAAGDEHGGEPHDHVERCFCPADS